MIGPTYYAPVLPNIEFFLTLFIQDSSRKRDLPEVLILYSINSYKRIYKREHLHKLYTHDIHYIDIIFISRPIHIDITHIYIAHIYITNIYIPWMYTFVVG